MFFCLKRLLPKLDYYLLLFTWVRETPTPYQAIADAMRETFNLGRWKHRLHGIGCNPDSIRRLEAKAITVLALGIRPDLGQENYQDSSTVGHCTWAFKDAAYSRGWH